MHTPTRTPPCRRPHLAATALLSLLGALPAFALAAPPIKTGLWEITTDSQQINGKPMPDMSAQLAEQMKRMPPEMRAQMEAQMKARGVQMMPGAGGGMVVRTCITQDMLDQNRWQKTEGQCQNTDMKQSGSTWNWKFSCTQPPSEGEGSTTFQGSEAYTSDMRVSTQHNGQKQTMTMKHRAKWVGASCGDLKAVGSVPKR